jgi:hypothetical protein
MSDGAVVHGTTDAPSRVPGDLPDRTIVPDNCSFTANLLDVYDVTR